MKKLTALVITFTFLVSMAAPVLAEVPKPVDKLVKGTVEVVKSPIELYDHTKKEMEGSKFMPLSLVKGLVMAPFHVIAKAGHGALDVATFPID